MNGAIKGSLYYLCIPCGFIYDPTRGHQDSGLLPGTAWQCVPVNWRCPDCGAMKEDFEAVVFCTPQPEPEAAFSPAHEADEPGTGA